MYIVLYMSRMSVKTIDAALEICENSDWTVSNLRLQKILYICHKVFMGRNNREPLIRSRFEAWDYGPVLPMLYHQFKFFGSRPIRDAYFWADQARLIPESKKDEKKMIEVACSKLISYTSSQLVTMTHASYGAWQKCYVADGIDNIIPNEMIYKEYEYEKYRRRKRQER